MFYVIFVKVNYFKRDIVNKIDMEIGFLEEKI